MSGPSVEERARALRDLIRLRVPVGDGVATLRRFPWDSADELATLTRNDALELIDRYLNGWLSSDDVVEWANALEGRDDVGLADQYSDLLSQLLLELANPALFGPLSVTFVRGWRDQLRSS